MERIVTQTIPAAVIDNPRVDWDPFTNKVTPSPAAEIEEGTPPKDRVDADAASPTRATSVLLDDFPPARAIDPYSPTAPT